MDSNRWQRIGNLFDQALERPPAARRAFLDEACADDPALRDQVLALLEADADPHPALKEDPAASGTPPPPVTDGQRIGPYRILGILGEGGMGTVYLAEREDVGAPVAIKVVRGGPHVPRLVERFRHERRILARLQHPHIARFLDAGVTEPAPGQPGDGAPYVVMEYVDGEPLDAYCDTRRLPVPERLRLFADAGRAVQYAHQNFVVHRDLKPSNILVTEDEAGRPQVKLLDFGIAKLTGDEALDATGLTRTGMRVLTPEYAAPEQVRGEPVSAATDVYALGVLLYELLTGQRPYDVTGDSAFEAERAILNTEPEKPSTAVTRTAPAETQDAVSPEQARSTTTEQLRRTLRGDLDTIVLKALRKEPERRYASAEAFVDDIKRYLEGLPVTARPDTFSYRASKFVRRHRGAVATVLAVVTLLIAGTAFYIQQITRERNRARRETAKATAVKDFMVDLFEVSDPDAAQGETITARALLERGSERILSRLDEQPEVRAEMLETIGNVYFNMGLYPKAETLFTQALAARRTLHGTDQHPDVAALLHDLGNVHLFTGDYELSDSLHRQALAIWRSTTGPNSLETARGLFGRSLSLINQGRYDDAEPLLREALDGFQAHLDAPHPDIASALYHMGFLLHEKDRIDETENYYRRALAMRRQLHGNVHSHVATILNSLGVIKGQKRSDLGAADSLFREALAIRHQLYGDEHPEIANSLNNIARLALAQGHFEEAERLYKELVPMVRRTLGEQHPAMSIVTTNLAQAYHEQGKLDQAETTYEKALTLCEQTLPPNHPSTASTQLGLVKVWLDQRSYAEAETLARDALAIRQATFGDTSASARAAESLLAASLLGQRQYAEAETLLTIAYPVLEEAYGTDGTITRGTRERLARLYETTGRPDEAARYRRTAE